MTQIWFVVNVNELLSISLRELLFIGRGYLRHQLGFSTGPRPLGCVCNLLPESRRQATQGMSCLNQGLFFFWLRLTFP